ncbi:MAG TPA: LysM peptidoglycan-binding domain-containing protein [Anaerolineaceae bacterium]
MKHRLLFMAFPLALLLVFSLLAVTAVQGSPLPQAAYNTPTARPDGRIIYVVQPGDNCVRISLLTGVQITDLRLLNNLDKDCTIRAGQELLIGRITPVAQATVGPTLTPTSLLPLSTLKGTGKLCILLFNDMNGNAMREASEPTLAGGAVSITDRSGKTSLTGKTTTSEEGVCFEVTEGEYSVSMAAPEGYNPTMNMNASIKILAGDTSIMDFGAQISTRAVTPVPVSEGGRSPLLGIVGGILILGGVVIGLYMRLIRR